MKLVWALVLAAVSLAAHAQSKLPAATPVDATVTLTWNAPAPGDDPVAGYDVFRSIGGGFAQINPDEISATEFVDAGPLICECTYYVVSVDVDGVQSAPSNTWTAAVPADLDQGELTGSTA